MNNSLVQIQKTIITQKLIEHLEILQMPSFDLVQHIDEIMKANPLLEYDTQEPTSELDELLANNTQEYQVRSERVRTKEAANADEFLAYVKTSLSLEEYLRLQLSELKISLKMKKLTEFLIGNLDGNGYLREDIRELAGILGLDIKYIKPALKVLQSLEPAGVGARDLRECLLLQLKRKQQLDFTNATIILNHFDLLANRSFLKISKETGIAREQVEQTYALIKSLNPRPGSEFHRDAPGQFVVPDLILEEVNGKFILNFNDETIPQVRINNYYVSLLKNGESSRELKEYIKKNLNGAVSLVKVIEQRKKTILDIAYSIVDFQEDFFKLGPEHFKPLTMQTVADSLKMHVSTVSRAVNGKYMQTSKGIYPLKFFFSSNIESDMENKTSGMGVKNMIRRIILDEDGSEPLSDEKLRGRLEKEGIKISRRTVAKYREELSILPAALRKKY